MDSIEKILKQNRFTLSAEIIPPRNGTESDITFSQIEILKNSNVNFISVTKGAGGSLRGGTLPIAHTIQSRYGITSLAHFTCRDYTIEEIENNLIDHHYLNVHNILALRGDPPDGKEDFFKPSPNKHSYAYQLVEQIENLNKGLYLVRQGYDDVNSNEKSKLQFKQGKPLNFCIGVAAYPEFEPENLRYQYFKLKVQAGAKFAITQMLFSPEPYLKFVDKCLNQNINIPILPGLRIVTDYNTALRMIKKFDSKIPQSFLEKLQNAKSKEDAKKIGLEHTYSICEKLKAQKICGLHIFVMNDAQTAATLLKML
jgi:methylenetetrahydrofolate reductase (NADPH)